VELWSELFSDTRGILSALVIGFMILMAVFFTWYFIGHMMKESEENTKKMEGSDRSNTMK